MLNRWLKKHFYLICIGPIYRILCNYKVWNQIIIFISYWFDAKYFILNGLLAMAKISAGHALKTPALAAIAKEMSLWTVTETFKISKSLCEDIIICRSQTRKRKGGNDNKNLPRLLKQALDLLSPSLDKVIRSGFRKTSIYPLNMYNCHKMKNKMGMTPWSNDHWWLDLISKHCMPSRSSNRNQIENEDCI